MEEKIVKNYLYLSKLAAQMVTLTPSENISLHLYECQNKNFNFGTLKTFILHARSIFFKGGHPAKIWRKKIFFMKTLSKLGALTVRFFTLRLPASGSWFFQSFCIDNVWRETYPHRFFSVKIL